MFIAKIFETPRHFSVTDVVDNSTASPGDNLFYNIVVTNTGFDTASGVLNITSLREIFHKCRGEVTCTFNSPHNRASVQFGSLAPGGKVIVQLFASVLKSAGDYNLVTNTATVTSGAPYNEEDTATATTTVREKADIRLYSSLIDSTNGLLHYQHKVTNSAGDNAHAVLLLDPLPAHTTFVSASTTMGKCSFHPTIGTYGAVRCPIGNLKVFTSALVDVVLQASSDACPVVTNSTSVTSQSIQGLFLPSTERQHDRNDIARLPLQ